jgi:hypothetical protein
LPLDDTHPRTKAKPAIPLDRTATITEAFGEIGIALPRSRNAQDKLADEYWAASVLAGLAEKRREKAKRAAVAGNVLPDHAAHPLAIGTAETVYTGALVRIDVKVVEQADRVDVVGFVADLERAGVKLATLKRLRKKHTKSFAGAHVFTASLINGTET